MSYRPERRKEDEELLELFRDEWERSSRFWPAIGDYFAFAVAIEEKPAGWFMIRSRTRVVKRHPRRRRGGANRASSSVVAIGRYVAASRPAAI